MTEAHYDKRDTSFVWYERCGGRCGAWVEMCNARWEVTLNYCDGCMGWPVCSCTQRHSGSCCAGKTCPEDDPTPEQVWAALGEGRVFSEPEPPQR